MFLDVCTEQLCSTLYSYSTFLFLSRYGEISESQKASVWVELTDLVCFLFIVQMDWMEYQ